MQQNTVKKVVGLQYEMGQGLPQLILKGQGKSAEAILDAVDPKRGPQIIENEALLKQLYRLPIDAEIGSELFHMVAMLLAHVFSVEEKRRGENHD